jgi:3-hydroxyisobutyrate dehydrogenase-like beta-hydroxyacid dehydrogenase
MGIRLGVIGFGEVGQILARGLQGQPGVEDVQAWDILFAVDGPTGDSMRAAASAAGIRQAASAQDLCGRCNFILSAVTASNDLAVAREVAQFVQAGTFLVDLNSASPGTKKLAAAAVDAAGGHYVEAGVMTSVPPYGIRVPMLLGGAQAAAVAQTFSGWGMDAKVVSSEIGVASAIKMSRSIMIKGMEALVIEAYTNARAYGVESHVLATLQETFPHMDWPAQGAYFFSRVVQHGRRRTEEMREAARTVDETGIEPRMTQATADKQQWVAELAQSGVFADIPRAAPWEAYADALIRHLGKS